MMAASQAKGTDMADIGDSSDFDSSNGRWPARATFLAMDVDLPGAFTQGPSAARAVSSAFLMTRPGDGAEGLLGRDLMTSAGPITWC